MATTLNFAVRRRAYGARLSAAFRFYRVGAFFPAGFSIQYGKEANRGARGDAALSERFGVMTRFYSTNVTSSRALRLAILGIGLFFCARVGHCESPANIRDLLPREMVVVMAHRGMGEEAPEGTIESFRAAWAMGFAPEADIRTTKDGVVVSFHDDNFKRIIPDAPDDVKNRGVKDLTFDELLTLDVGAYMGERFKGQRAVSMDQIIAALREDPDRVIFCDLKNVDLPRFAEQTREVWMQICLTSSDYATLKKWKELAPESKTRLWTQRAWVDRPDQFEEEMDKLIAQNFDALDIIQAHAKVDAQGVLTPDKSVFEKIALAAQKQGVLFEVMPLTYGDQTFPYRALLDAGVSALSTDYPSATSRALDEYYRDAPNATRAQ